MGSLSGKTAVVTGASSGIGLATAQLFAESGAHVYLTARREEQLNSAVSTVNGSAVGVVADVSRPADLDRLVQTVQTDGRQIDVLVANAGGGALSTLEETTEEQFDALFNTNVRGTYFTLQKALPLLADGGAVVVMSSIAADLGSAGFGVYAATKASLRSFARTWAVELAPRGIRVNTISPGAVWTPAMGKGHLDATQEAAIQQSIGKSIPLGRMAEASEIADAALFLVTPASKFITGTNVTVDGGQNIVRDLGPS